jgi:cytosine/adenosine deaminase-related metal-dependent hydrolase
MQSDIVLIDIRDPAMRPVRDPLRSMLYSAGSRVVRHVFIGGRQVVRDREVLTMDLESALIDVEKWQRRALEEAPTRSFVKLPADRLSPLSLPVAGEA